MKTLPADLLHLLLFGAVYLFFFVSYFFSKKYIFLGCIFSFIVFYDFVFIQIAPDVSPLVFYIIKSWQEYLTVFLLLVMTLSQRYRLTYFSGLDIFVMVGLAVLTLAGFGAGLVKGVAPGAVILGWRMYLLPFIWSFLLYKTGLLREVKTIFTLKYFVAVSVIVVCFAIYQVQLFQQDLRILWFYDFINELNPIATHEFDFVRDDQLRASGIFVSPLIYSLFLSFALLMLFYRLILGKRELLKDLLTILLLALLCYGQVLSHTRIGFIVFGLAVGVSALVYFFPRTRYFFLFMLPAGLAAFTLALLIAGITNDPSALGRLIQYASLPTHFKLQGLGFGSDETNVFFDSYYLSVTVLFGVFTPIFILIYYFILKHIGRIARVIRNRFLPAVDYMVFYATFGFCFSFIYTFAFHFTTGSATFQLFVLMLFYLLAVYRSFREPKTISLSYAPT